MRRHHRTAGGPTAIAHKASGTPVPDPLTLIRAFDSESNPTRPVRPSPLTASTIQGLPLDLLDRLRSFPLFLSAPDSFLAAIGTHLRPQLYAPHDYILTEGDEAKAMYWLVRGAVRVTSRDGESTYAELRPGAFFGEIGILMDIPRTATIIAKLRSLVVRLNKEDLKKELPNFPEVERVIMDEAKERLAILERKKKERAARDDPAKASVRTGKRSRDRMSVDIEMGEVGVIKDSEALTTHKKRKSPSPSLAEAVASSALGTGSVNVRSLLMELPLFTSLPPEILHFLGLNAIPRTYPPFTDIIQEGSQGRDVFFIVRGEVEVVTEAPARDGIFANVNPFGAKPEGFHQVKARLKPGQYFGEVTSLSLAPRRTATVRSISAVECLMIGGDVLDELWQMCSPDLRRQVEETARQRLQSARSRDTPMRDAPDGTPAISELAIADLDSRNLRKKSVPMVTFSEGTSEATVPQARRDSNPLIEPYDPDPFLNVDLDNMRSRSRRGSLAPPTPAGPDASQGSSMDSSQGTLNGHINGHVNGHHVASSFPYAKSELFTADLSLAVKRPRFIPRHRTQFGKGIFSDQMLINILKYLDVYQLMRLRLVSTHWMKLLTTSPHLLHVLDLTPYNRRVTDHTLANIICPFAGNRPRYVDISNCFHVTDEGFTALALSCAPNVRVWKMKSVWDITGQAVLEMVNQAKGLEEVDLSNCRKVGDNLLARVIGWVVPDIPPQVMQQQHHQQQNGRYRHAQRHSQSQGQQAPPGTVVGCPHLKKLTLSYCKHITDRSMAHIAVHASSRLEQLDLTRCTTISDQGFHHWSVYPFPRLRKLCLADCTYLTDNAIVYLTNAAKGLRELDLVSTSAEQPK